MIWTTDVINNSISPEVLSMMDDSDLFVISKNKNNEIEMIDYNTYMVNMFLKDIVDNVQSSFEELESNNISFYIPFGVLFQNVFFNNVGPKIPVKVELVGSISSNIETSVKEYGINNSLIEMSIKVEVKERIMLPIMSDTIKVETSIPLSYKIITGTIPNYYGSNLGRNSSIYSTTLE